MEIITELDFPEISPLQLTIGRLSKSKKELHTHEGYEIYCNIKGNVSFLIEKGIYYLSSGTVAVVEPFEAHHCIYHDNEENDHIWIMLCAKNSKKFFDTLFGRNFGKHKLINLDHDRLSSLVNICGRMTNAQITQIEKYYLFFKLINLIANGIVDSSNIQPLRNEISFALDFINNNIQNKISISDLAKNCHMSLKNFERYFKVCTDMTPTSYINSKRLCLAKELLKKDLNVTEVSEMCGFSNSSSFITAFKKQFGITPFKFSKQ